jgi:hypothetical protein
MIEYKYKEILHTTAYVMTNDENDAEAQAKARAFKYKGPVVVGNMIIPYHKIDKITYTVTREEFEVEDKS